MPSSRTMQMEWPSSRSSISSICSANDGLMQEAKIAREIFLGNGFEVEAICCKVGSIEKEKVGVKDEADAMSDS